MKITYSYDGEIILGTGGAIKNAFSYISEDFLIIYGDSYLDINYKSVFNFFQKKSNTKNGLMTVFKNENKFDKSNIVFKQNKIINYSKKEITADMNYIE